MRILTSLLKALNQLPQKLLSVLHHRLGLNTGYPRVWRRGDGYLMAGFYCHDCGQMHDIDMCPESMQPWVSGMVECEDCKNRWAAVRMLGICLLECPQCGHQTRAKEVAT